MELKREASDVGAGRTWTHAVQTAPTIGFEWMSFSGLMRLSGAGELLPPGTTFWGALVTADRGRVREGLERAAKTRAPVTLTCRLASRSGVRTYLLEGEVVAGERALAPRVMGVLVEIRPAAGQDVQADALDALVERLAGALGEAPAEEPGSQPPPESSKGAEA